MKGNLDQLQREIIADLTDKDEREQGRQVSASKMESDERERAEKDSSSARLHNPSDIHINEEILFTGASSSREKVCTELSVEEFGRGGGESSAGEFLADKQCSVEETSQRNDENKEMNDDDASGIEKKGNSSSFEKGNSDKEYEEEEVAGEARERDLGSSISDMEQKKNARKGIGRVEGTYSRPRAEGSSSPRVKDDLEIIDFESAQKRERSVSSAASFSRSKHTNSLIWR